MGWTKHRDAIDDHRKMRSNSLTRLKKLTPQILQDLKKGQVDFDLVREFHAVLQDAAKLGVALSAYEQDLSPYFDILLRVTGEWVIGTPYDNRIPHRCTPTRAN